MMLYHFSVWLIELLLEIILFLLPPILPMCAIHALFALTAFPPSEAISCCFVNCIAANPIQILGLPSELGMVPIRGAFGFSLQCLRVWQLAHSTTNSFVA